MGFVGLDITEVRRLADDLEKSSSGASRLHRDLGDLLHRASEGYGGKPASSDPTLQGITTGVVPGVPAYGVRAPDAPSFRPDAGSVPGVLATALPALAKEMRRRCAQAESAGNHPNWHITAEAAFNDDHMPLPKGRDPKTIHSWWSALPKDTRDDLITSEPHKIGGLNGVPSADRDRANRIYLPILHNKLLAERDALVEKIHAVDPSALLGQDTPGTLPKKDVDVLKMQARLWSVENNLKGLKTVESRINAPVKHGMPKLFVIGLGGQDDGRAIVARGNPDTADHTVVYTPGTFAMLSSVGDDLSRSDTIWRASHQEAGPGSKISSVTWLGYDAPNRVFPFQDGLQPGSEVPEAIERKWADRAGPDFNNYIEGVRATHEGPRGHVTALGHSYGSTVIGASAAHRKLDVDDVVVAGSPSMRVNRAEDLGVPKGHVWAEGAGGLTDDSAVRDGGKMFLSPHSIEGLPESPTDPAFEANRMLSDAKNHRDYWRYSAGPAGMNMSTSLKNQVRVFVGKQDEVTYEPHGHAGEY